MKIVSLSQLKKVLFENEENFPLDWNLLDVKDLEELVHEYIERFGWKDFFLSPAFYEVQSPKLIFSMMKNGLDIDIYDQDFENIFVKALKSTGTVENASLMKQFVGLLKFKLAGKTYGQIF